MPGGFRDEFDDLSQIEKLSRDNHRGKKLLLKRAPNLPKPPSCISRSGFARGRLEDKMVRAIQGQLMARLTLSVAFLGLPGCGGDATFSGPGGSASADQTKGKDGEDDSGKEVDEPPPDDGNPATQPPFASLTWFWQCDAAPVDAPAPKTDKDVVVEGIGPHEFDKDQLRGTPVTISGNVCAPEQLPRDIVFVVDVSGSNGNQYNADGSLAKAGNDPLDGTGGCGRLTALKSTMAAIPAGTARFGLVTFSDGVKATSSGFFESGDLLFANLAPAGNIADVVCAAAGGTQYDDAFIGASGLLSTGADDATKEIYFISDGQPDLFANGVPEATELKNVGVAVGTELIIVTIAGIMLKGVDQVIEQQLVSTDSSGKKLYAHVEDSAGLTEALASLAANEIAGGEVKYRPIGGTDYTTLPLKDHLQGFNFTLPSFNIDIEKAPLGLEMLFEYFDRHDNRYATGGKILWVAADESSSP